MIHIQDITGELVGPDPIVWEARAERWGHGGVLESRRVQLRKSDCDRIGDGLAAHKAQVSAEMILWERGELPTPAAPAVVVTGTAGTVAAVETEPPRPAHCQGVPEERCGLLNDDEATRQDIGNFADPDAWACYGCGYRSDRPDDV